METTVVINTKGGVGKTTVTTNLASYFAARNVPTTILDYDPQGSSLNWLQQRPPMLGRIQAANAAPTSSGLRSLAMHVPANTQQLIIDAPAGASKLLQQDILRKANHIIIPVAPSPIDIHATAQFVQQLLLASRVRASGTRVAVVANRVRNSDTVYAPLERFLRSLRMPLVARLRDSEVYIASAEHGLGIFEIDEAMSARERQEFMPIIEWLVGGCSRSDSGKVVSMSSSRAGAGTAAR